MLQSRESGMVPIIQRLQTEINEFDMLPMKVRHTHLNKGKRGVFSDSVFVYREPTIIRENRTLIGSQSILPGKKPAGKNQQTKSSRGFCSLFGIGGSKK